jgi:hypothetical protein
VRSLALHAARRQGAPALGAGRRRESGSRSPAPPPVRWRVRRARAHARAQRTHGALRTTHTRCVALLLAAAQRAARVRCSSARTRLEGHAQQAVEVLLWRRRLVGAHATCERTCAHARARVRAAQGRAARNRRRAPRAGAHGKVHERTRAGKAAAGVCVLHIIVDALRWMGTTRARKVDGHTRRARTAGGGATRRGGACGAW